MAIPLKPPLAVEFVRDRLAYNPDTGIFTWRAHASQSKRWNSRYAGTIAGSHCRGYTQIQLPKPQNYYAHQIAWLLVYGVWPSGSLDHINGCRSDNRIDNLRLATTSQNNCNRARQRNNSSGYTGICWNKQAKKWEARIYLDNRKLQWREFFTDKHEAAAARRAKLSEIHGEFARH